MKKNQNSQKHLYNGKQYFKKVNGEIISESDPFIIPDGYFDELPQRVMDKITLKQKEQQANINPGILLRRIWVPISLAATIALFLILRQPYTQNNNSTVSDSIVLTYQSPEYDPTYADEALMIEESSITENDEAQIDLMSMSTDLNSYDTTEISTDEMIQFLIDENYDTDLITEL
jgi:hypothetical protein